MGCKEILLAMSVVFISACSSKSSDTIDVDSDDEEMNAAITKANYTFNQFKDVLVSGDTSIRLISIKLSVETNGGGAEHIWISDVEIESDTLYGYVDNQPRAIPNLKEGDYIQILPGDKISDWMYVRNDTLFGGFTLRLLRSRMQEEERSDWDKEMGVIILD